MRGDLNSFTIVIKANTHLKKFSKSQMEIPRKLYDGVIDAAPSRLIWTSTGRYSEVIIEIQKFR